MKQQTLRFPRVDDETLFVLAHITPNGTLPLDLKVEATEGESPYIGYLKQSAGQLGEPAKNYHGSAENWKSVLRCGLGQQDADPIESDVTGGLQVVAQIEPSGRLIIIFRKNVGGITQRIGTVTLQQNDSLELSIFNWAGQAVNASYKAQREISSLRLRFAEQQQSINKLQAQLDELVKRKEEHVAALFNKFQRLLNSKKLKIRDQQRLLARAKVDPETAAEVRENGSVNRSGKAGSSKTQKRRAGTVIDEDESGENGNDVSVDGDRSSNGGDGDVVATPDRSGSDTTEEDGEIEGFAPSPSISQDRGHNIDAKGKAIEAVASKGQQSLQELEELPPRRELPFQKPDQQPTEQESTPLNRSSTPQVPEDEETTDDEL